MPEETSIKQRVDQLAAKGKVAAAAELLKEQPQPVNRMHCS
jgi:hypothetical protein